MFISIFDGACTLTSVAYPVFASYKALEQRDGEAQYRWLTYWIVFSTVNTVESYIGFFVNWVPFYGLVKFGFLTCLASPSTGTCSLVYNSYIRPTLESHEGELERLTTSVRTKAYNTADALLHSLTGYHLDQVLSLVLPSSNRDTSSRRSSISGKPASPKQAIDVSKGFSLIQSLWNATSSSNNGVPTTLVPAPPGQLPSNLLAVPQARQAFFAQQWANMERWRIFLESEENRYATPSSSTVPVQTTATTPPGSWTERVNKTGSDEDLRASGYEFVKNDDLDIGDEGGSSKSPETTPKRRSGWSFSSWSSPPPQPQEPDKSSANKSANDTK